MSIFSEKDQLLIVNAIKEAENNTSGEIKVHLEPKCPSGSVFDRAKEVFEYLSLHKTALRNGVLIYISYEDRKYAILGDKGIDAIVGPEFWDSSAVILKEYLSSGNIPQGLIYCIAETGKQLQRYFPLGGGENKNEIPDQISFG